MVKLDRHMLKLVVFVVCSSIIIKLEGAAVQNGKCSRVTRCGKVEIRFPFYLKDTNGEQHNKDDHCVFPPEFQVSCGKLSADLFWVKDPVPMMEFEYQVNTSLPGLYLSFSVEAAVVSIDHRSQQLHYFPLDQNIVQHYYSSHNHLRRSTSLSNSPFKPFTITKTQSTNKLFGFYDRNYGGFLNDYSFYNCSDQNRPRFPLPPTTINPVASMRGPDYKVYAIYSDIDILEAQLASCTKMYNFSDVPYNVGGLNWSKPDCKDCEAKGEFCKFKPDSTTHTLCYPKPRGPPSRKLFRAGIFGGSFFTLLTVVTLYYATNSYIQKKRYQSNIEIFLEDYKAHKPSRYSYADIKKISNQFKVKIGEGGYGSVFKGQLSNDVVVAVKVLNDEINANGTGEDFINEVSTIGLVHHVNVVRLVGYCADGRRRALVYEFLPNNSLAKYAYSREKQNEGFLGWEKMQDIALGIAKGMEYLHQGCAQPIVHFDIKPHNILLDQDFNPKISDFGLAKLGTKGQSMVSMTTPRGTIGYIAPEVFSRNFGKASSKSDVYSFGMLLLEMVGARDHTSVRTDSTSEAYFPEWVFHQLEKGRETTSQIEEELNSDIEKKLTIVGLWCINWHPADRPSMKRVIQMLQEEDCPAIPPNPFNSASTRNASTFSITLEAISESD